VVHQDTALPCAVANAILLRGLSDVQDGRELVDAQVLDQRDGEKHTISLVLGSQTYQLRAALNPEEVDDASQHMVLLLRRGRSDQILLGMATPDFSVLWAGDLDGDGMLDFVLQMDSREDTSTTLYMGRRDDAAIVRVVALFDRMGC
jgi:hypothetical protein